MSQLKSSYYSSNKKEKDSHPSIKATLTKLATVAKNSSNPFPGRTIDKGESRGAPDLRPGCTFGALLEERLKAISAEISEIKNRVNALLFAVVIAVIVDVVMRLAK